MALNIRHVVLLVAYAVGINLLLVAFSNAGVGITCSNLEEDYQDYSQGYNLTEDNNTEIKESSASIIDLALGRCEGLPYWFFILLELPVILGLLYIIRGFIGVT